MPDREKVLTVVQEWVAKAENDIRGGARSRLRRHGKRW